MEEYRIICGIPEGMRENSLPEKVAEQLAQAGCPVTLLGCGSKQEVEYAVFREKEGVCVLIEEDGFVGNPYRAWEIADLRDVGRVNLVVLVNRRHYGTAYLNILYSAGILNAVFEEDRDAVLIAGLFRKERRRRECREYYGIHSLKEASSVLQVMEKERIERYARYIGSGVNAGDMLARYREVEKQLRFVENCCLVENLPESVLGELREDGGLERYCVPGTPLSQKNR